MMRPQCHRIHLIVRIAAKQAIGRVLLCRKCNNPVGGDAARVQPRIRVGIPLRMLRNQMLQSILLFGIN